MPSVARQNRDRSNVAVHLLSLSYLPLHVSSLAQLQQRETKANLGRERTAIFTQHENAYSKVKDMTHQSKMKNLVLKSRIQLVVETHAQFI
jgi:hypothetical protein